MNAKHNSNDKSGVSKSNLKLLIQRAMVAKSDWPDKVGIHFLISKSVYSSF